MAHGDFLHLVGLAADGQGSSRGSDAPTSRLTRCRLAFIDGNGEVAVLEQMPGRVTTTITIRRGTPDDAPSIVSVWQAIVAEKIYSAIES
jgi:hypothetical protein